MNSITNFDKNRIETPVDDRFSHAGLPPIPTEFVQKEQRAARPNNSHLVSYNTKQALTYSDLKKIAKTVPAKTNPEVVSAMFEPKVLALMVTKAAQQDPKVFASESKCKQVLSSMKDLLSLYSVDEFERVLETCRGPTRKLLLSALLHRK